MITAGATRLPLEMTDRIRKATDQLPRRRIGLRRQRIEREVDRSSAEADGSSAEAGIAVPEAGRSSSADVVATGERSAAPLGGGLAARKGCSCQMA
jgi:hypothetical protein